MKKKSELWVIVISSLVFTFIFYKQRLGLNLFLYEIGIFTFLFFTKQISFNTQFSKITTFGFLASSVFVVITNSTYAVVVNFIMFFVFIGVLVLPKAQSFIYILSSSFDSLFSSQALFFSKLSDSRTKGSSIQRSLAKLTILLLPLFVLLFFVYIYRNASPVFDTYIVRITDMFSRFLERFFDHIEVALILTLTAGLVIGNFVFFRNTNEKIALKDSLVIFDIIRKRRKDNRHRTMDLKSEYKATIFLFFTLNVVLFSVNIIDVNSVWLNFNWKAQDLKQFVHEGTYLLILSILISIALVLFVFRNNINFYKKNVVLKYLTYAWLMQNAFLAVSVVVRNIWYINYFSLAYKRIGVIVFIFLTLYGLYSVYIKVRFRKNDNYLLNVNAFALYLVLLVTSFFNWDSIITKYNFEHAHSSFLHLDYLSKMSDKSLPLLNKSYKELYQYNDFQSKKFPYSQKLMQPKTFYNIIQERNRIFKKRWENKTIFEWNLAEYLAYRKL